MRLICLFLLFLFFSNFFLFFLPVLLFSSSSWFPSPSSSFTSSLSPPLFIYTFSSLSFYFSSLSAYCYYFFFLVSSSSSWVLLLSQHQLGLMNGDQEGNTVIELVEDLFSAHTINRLTNIPYYLVFARDPNSLRDCKVGEDLVVPIIKASVLIWELNKHSSKRSLRYQTIKNINCNPARQLLPQPPTRDEISLTLAMLEPTLKTKSLKWRGWQSLWNQRGYGAMCHPWMTTEILKAINL